MGYLDKNGLSRAFTKLKTLIDKKANADHTHPVDSSLSSTSTNPVQNKVVNSALSRKVPTTRKVNGKTLSADVTLSASDVGAADSAHNHNDLYYTETEMDDKLSEKAASVHTHSKSQIIDFPTSMPASDVSAWAKAATKPTYTKSEVGLGNVDNTADADKSVKYATTAGTANYLNANQLTTESLNNIKTTGTYYAGGSNTVTNKPSGVDAFGLTVQKTASGYIAQILIEGNTSAGKTWIRQFNTSSWSDWGYYYSNLHKPTPSDIGAAASSHTHTKSQITDFPTSMKNPNSLTISLNGTSQGAYNGSAAKSVNVTPSSIGAAASSHTHNDIYYTETEMDSKLDGKVPTTRKVNGKALSADISLTASDVGAAASSHSHANYYDSGTSRTANTVLAAPNGSAGGATFRKLVAADIPSITKSKISDFPTSMPASDVSSWAKASTKPSYSYSEITGTIDATSKLSGVIPAANLPSYVDDVIEGYLSGGKFYKTRSGTSPSFTYSTEITGEAGKIYTDLATSKIYRWSGSAFAVISDTIALGETSSTAYRGDRGKTAYNHSQVTSGNPHKVTKSDVGLGNVENKSSATIRGELTKANVTTALGYTPPTTNTTYPVGSATATGTTKLYTGTGTATDGTMTQNAITTALNGKANSSHTHNYAGSSSSGGAATKANGIVVSDTRSVNSAPNDAAFDKNMLTADFKNVSTIGSPSGFGGTYCGLLSLAPWSETSGGHGYQMAFGYNSSGHPRLALRGSDLSATAWDNWYKIYTSDDKPTKSDVGLGNVDNTADANKSVKYATSAGSAATLTTTRTINGTNFNGSANITTANWGTSRNVYIADSDGTNTGTAVSVNGGANATLKLPATIKATLSGNATTASSCSGNAATATKLATSRTIQTNLSSTSSASFNGSANITPGITGTLPIGNGGTGTTTANGIRTNIGVNPVTTAGTGAAYTATVNGITSLTAGVKFTMVPHTVSTTTAPTLNVNGLGAKNLRMRLSGYTSATTTLIKASSLAASKPVDVMYDGTQWVIDGFRPNATGLYGTVPISGGGTGATTAAAARDNLSVKPIYYSTSEPSDTIPQGSVWINPNSGTPDVYIYI